MNSTRSKRSGPEGDAKARCGLTTRPGSDSAGLAQISLSMARYNFSWTGLASGHGFHATKHGERYTLSESARRTVLDRLLALSSRN